MGSRGNKFSADEQRTLMTLWAIARSPLIMGEDRYLAVFNVTDAARDIAIRWPELEMLTSARSATCAPERSPSGFEAGPSPSTGKHTGPCRKCLPRWSDLAIGRSEGSGSSAR